VREKRFLPALVVALAVAPIAGARAQDQDQAPIQDNSFLVEEAYNQAPGVVQHINVLELPRDGGSDWDFTFTQEWPLRSGKNQLSYTIPAARFDGRTGVGDVLLHWRLQLVGGSDARFSLTPRVSLIVPTGDTERVPNTGGGGLEVAWAASLVLSDHLVSHTNAGATRVHRAHNLAGDKADLESIFAAQSFVWLLRPKLNLMLEALWERADEVGGPGLAPTIESLFINPGLRFAIDEPSGLQIVPGLSFPMEIGSGEGSRSVLLYLSFEHPFGRR
jgi:hypothetical protein